MPSLHDSEPAAAVTPDAARRSLDDANSSEEETREQLQDNADDALLVRQYSILLPGISILI